MKDNNIKILIIVSIAIIGISIIGGTYAYLTMSVNVTNGTYNNVGTYCLDINYSINNVDNTQDITGTLFPSGTINKGLNGRVGIKTASGCAPTAKGLLKLHIDSSTDPQLTAPASSYCESRSTLEALTEYTTESACTTAGGRWRDYGGAYCENPNTLERLPDYMTESDCTSHSGTWTSGGSPLKYAVFNTTEANATPVSVGKINTTDIGNDVTIYNNFTITATQAYYYIYIWLDGYLTDNSHTSLPFVGTISAEAGLTELEPPSPYVYTANIYDNNAQGYNSVWIGQSIPNGITTYTTSDSAMAALKMAGGGTTDYPFFLRHTLGDGTVWCATDGTDNYCVYETQSECNSTVTDDFGSGFSCQSQNYTNGVSQSYVGFVVTPTMAANNTGMTAGTYYLKGGDNGRSYNENKATLLSAFGSTYCSDNSSGFDCSVSGLNAGAYLNGNVEANDGDSAICGVNYSGNSGCEE
ncbi:MAG: hypothetical protein IKI04_02065 [Bacilli bacterium]|nr:hypothetical protein [Bacilli bacterium]